MTPSDLVTRMTHGIMLPDFDRLLLSASIFMGHHILLLGPSGVGKSYSASLLARNTDRQLSRIQMMSDMFSSDILGAEILRGEQFEIRKGPIFRDMVLIDEINRSSARLYAAFLEALSDARVTIAGETLALPSGFSCLATLNDFYDVGVAQMPVALLERFALSIVFDYPSADAEVDLLRSAEAQTDIDSYDREEIAHSQVAIRAVYTSDALLYYIRDLVHATRREGINEIISPLSLRASMVLKELSQLSAWYEGRSYALPEDVTRMLTAVARHRMAGVTRDVGITRGERELHFARVLEKLVSAVPIASLEHVEFFDRKNA